MKRRIKAPVIVFPTIEEMNCKCCKAVTGHKIKENKWVCVICQTPSK